MTHQQIIRLAEQAELEGNFRFADFLDRELVRVSFNPLGLFGRGTGKATELALLKGVEKGVANSVGQGFTETGINRAFQEVGEGATGAALRSLETATPKSGNIFQEAGGMLTGKGNKVITRTLEEIVQVEAQIKQIIIRIAQRNNEVEQLRNLIKTIPENHPDKVKFTAELEAKIANLNRSNSGSIAQKYLNGEKLTQEELQVLYKEILQTDPSAFAGKSKMRPSDAYEMLVNKKITPEMNKITSGLGKFFYAPTNTKAGKWGTGLLAGGLAYGALNYGLPLLGTGYAAAKAQLNKMQGENAGAAQGTAAQGGNVEGGSTTYGLGRDNASVGNYQYYGNRAPSATVANVKTKWIKTSDS